MLLTSFRRAALVRVAVPAALAVLALVPPTVTAQSIASSAAESLTLQRSRELARTSSPDLTAAREALAAATARERQAGAAPNPILSYSREQASGHGTTSSQNIAALEQRLELGGQRGARRAVAGAQRAAASARVDAAEARLDFEVARAYARVVTADRRMALVAGASEVFTRASQTSRARLAGGDVSGYEHRRLTLEATRFAALRAEASAMRRASRASFALLLFPDDNPVRGDSLVLADTSIAATLTLSADSLIALAVVRRADVHALEEDARAGSAEAELARRERVPSPALTAGVKTERVADGDDSLAGFVAGVSIPLPLWDRRTGAVEAARAEARRRLADVEVLKRQTRRDVMEAYVTHHALAEQLDTLRTVLGDEARRALNAVQASYTEGESSLVEWLDAVRAYLDVETTYARLFEDYLISRAALERAVGAPLP